MTLASNNSPIAVIGSGSMVGSRFCELWKNPQKLIKADLNSNPSVDITNEESVSQFFSTQDFDTAILFQLSQTLIRQNFKEMTKMDCAGK